MATRQTTTDKWDDDWYLGLPPRLKVAWDYICDTCIDGTGIRTLSFKKLSDQVGEPVTKSDLQESFGERLYWISDDKFWITGLIKFRYPNLNPVNDIHKRIVAKIVRTASDWNLPQKPRAFLNDLAAKFSLDALTGVSLPSCEPQKKATRHSNINNNINNNSLVPSSDLGGAGGATGGDGLLSSDAPPVVGPHQGCIPDLATPVTEPVLRNLNSDMQRKWLAHYGSSGTREEIAACILHHEGKANGEAVSDWGVKIVNWLNRARAQASGGRNDGLMASSGVVSIEAVKKERGLS